MKTRCYYRKVERLTPQEGARSPFIAGHRMRHQLVAVPCLPAGLGVSKAISNRDKVPMTSSNQELSHAQTHSICG